MRGDLNRQRELQPVTMFQAQFLPSLGGENDTGWVGVKRGRLGSNTSSWSSAEVICYIAFGIFTLALSIIWEWKATAHPVMPQGIFASITNCAILAVVFLHGLVFISGFYYLPLYFQAVRDATPLLSGVYLLPTALSLAFASIGTGIVVGKTGMFLPPIYFAFIALTLGYVISHLGTIGQRPRLTFAATKGTTIAALGVGPLSQAPIVAIQAHTDPRDIGTATATLGFIRSLATSISIVLGEVFYEAKFNNKVNALRPQLTADQAFRLIGSNTGVSLGYIAALMQPQKRLVTEALANSLQSIWIMYCCFAFVGFLIMFLIKNKKLTSEHHDTAIGLDAEKARTATRSADSTVEE